MSKSSVTFQRWKAREKSTWPFQVFNDYGLELDRIMLAHVSAHSYVYRRLKDAKAKWTDEVGEHFTFHQTSDSELYSDLKDWSQAYNQLDNWNNLNVVIALSSNLETYMASVIALALESDPGLLFGIPQRLDGVSILKHGTTKVDHNKKIEFCTRGDWQGRVKSFEALFGSVPSLVTDHIGELDQIRNLRNRVGHAFGRDIENARKHGVKEILPMESLKIETTLKYRRRLWQTAKAIDVQLLRSHIGEFQAIRFYHQLYPTLRKDVHPSIRAVAFKKEIGRFKAVLPGKLFCKELVAYYENL